MNSYPENISAEELQNLDLSWYKGEIVLVEDIETLVNVLPRFAGKKILGFDTETKPSFKKGVTHKVSLLQLATDDFACLFRINKIGIPDELADILSDPGVIKAGVAIHDDLKILKAIKKFNPGGFVDLQVYVKDFGIQSSGLKKLTAIVLGFRISKGQQVTNWEAEELTDAQKTYAATDAWVCHEIYNHMANESENS